jgi:hypothetical protein
VEFLLVLKQHKKGAMEAKKGSTAKGQKKNKCNEASFSISGYIFANIARRSS